MHVSKLFSPEFGEIEGEDGEECHDHVELKERLRKTLYFGKTPKMDRASLPMTELAVEFLQNATPRQLGKVDMQWASSVSRRASVSPCSLMLGMLYIERLKHKNPEYLQKMSSEDLFLISMMVASKYLYDEGTTEEVYNDEWAEYADLDTDDVNQLEQDFLSAIDWTLYMKDEDFWQTLHQCEDRIAWNQATRRGFFTYTDLDVLTAVAHVREACFLILTELCKVVAVCSVAYMAGTVTLACSPAALTCATSTMSSFPLPSTDDRNATKWPSDIREPADFQPKHELAGADIVSGGEDDVTDGTGKAIRDVLKAETEITAPSTVGVSASGFLALTLLRDALIGVLLSWKPGQDRSERPDSSAMPAASENRNQTFSTFDPEHDSVDPASTVRTSGVTCYACRCLGNGEDEPAATRNSGFDGSSKKNATRRKCGPDSGLTARGCVCLRNQRPGLRACRCLAWDSRQRSMTGGGTSRMEAETEKESETGRSWRLSSDFPKAELLTLQHQSWLPISVG